MVWDGLKPKQPLVYRFIGKTHRNITTNTDYASDEKWTGLLCSPFGAKARSPSTETSATPLTRPRFSKIQPGRTSHSADCQGMQANGSTPRRRFRRTRHEKTNLAPTPRGMTR